MTSASINPIRDNMVEGLGDALCLTGDREHLHADDSWLASQVASPQWLSHAFKLVKRTLPPHGIIDNERRVADVLRRDFLFELLEVVQGG